jgi:hypothetical protein
MRPRSARRPPDALRDSVLSAWSTSNLTTIYLVERLPDVVWTAALPGSPRRSVRMLAGHLHNSRCMWLKTLGRPRAQGSAAVDCRRVSGASADSAPGKRSGIADRSLRARRATIPAAGVSVRNLPLDVAHVLAYFVAHDITAGDRMVPPAGPSAARE